MIVNVGEGRDFIFVKIYVLCVLNIKKGNVIYFVVNK